jgi:hypothetical protein
MAVIVWFEREHVSVIASLSCEDAMEHFAISQNGIGLHIDGIPDGVKVVVIDNPQATKLSDLALHKDDLEFADACLDAINQALSDSHIMREALWRSAVVQFFKCFGTGARFRLTSEEIYKAEPPDA